MTKEITPLEAFDAMTADLSRAHALLFAVDKAGLLDIADVNNVDTLSIEAGTEMVTMAMQFVATAREHSRHVWQGEAA